MALPAFFHLYEPLGVDTLFGGNGASSNPVVNDDTPK
jgi:hypothetical protein